MTWNRRTFVKKGSLLCSGICGGALALVPGCTPVKYVSATRENNSLKVLKSDWGESDFILVKNPNLPAPIYLKQDGSQYLAVLLECTHKKCEVRPGSQLLKCPCHGSEYDYRGQVLQGPALRDLQTFTTRQDQIAVYIQ